MDHSSDSEKFPAAAQKAVVSDHGVYTIPASADFMRRIASQILKENTTQPLGLTDVTIYVPDDHSRRILIQAFHDVAKHAPQFLPRILIPGEGSAADMALRVAGDKALAQKLFDLPPPISRLERQMILAAEIMKIPGMASSVEKAIALGGELGRFLDQAQQNNVDLKKLSALVPAEFRGQWAATERYLNIIAEIWPQKLKELKRTDPEAHRLILIEAEAQYMQQQQNNNAVWAVGFDQAIPAVMSFLQSVHSAPTGRIVLPALDQMMEDADWAALTPVHPQFSLSDILKGLNVSRPDVQSWPDSVQDFTQKSRAKLLREALHPASTAEGWSGLKSRKTKRKGMDENKKDVIDTAAIQSLDMITVGSPQEEASVIALHLRKILETPDRTAAVITADRALARRISARLKHWKIDVDDSAGMALGDTDLGLFMQVTATMGAQNMAPVPLLQVLKHPLMTLGRTAAVIQAEVFALEETCLHGPRPAPGISGLEDSVQATFNRASRRRATASQDLVKQTQQAQNLIKDLRIAAQDFLDVMTAEQKMPLQVFLESHIRLLERFTATDDPQAPATLWQNTDGAQLARFLKDFRACSHLLPEMTGADYADVLRGVLKAQDFKSDAQPHARLKIMTPAQAALQKFDVAIVAGLNDEVWPPRVPHNPWISPEMANLAGLPDAMAEMGRSARHFVQALSTDDVTLSRAMRSGSAPAAASPFLTRLLMVLRGAGLEKDIIHKEKLVDINAALHAPDAVTPITAPEPRPAAALRPKELPVTAIENLMRDPYSVYARYILKLRPKPPIDAAPSASEKGMFTHDALDAFVRKYPDKLPDNAFEELLKIGAESFKTRMASPVVQAFWWPRFQRIAAWFVKFETNRRELSQTLGTEVQGKLTFDLGDGETFTLTAIADRIDIDDDKKLSMIDYKTGAIPAQKDVANGLSPQLTLEALIAISGGFTDVPAGAEVADLQYWKLSGGRPAAEVTDVKGDPEKLAAEAKKGVENLIKTFHDAATPYLPTPRPHEAPRFASYEHLARTGEWSMVAKTEAKPKPPSDKKCLPPRRSSAKKSQKKQG